MIKLHPSAQVGRVTHTAGQAATAIWEASHKIRCGCLECVHLARTRRCCLTSFWVAWARRMRADHCLELVLVRSCANCCRLLVQQSYPACGACGLCSLISNRGDLFLNAHYTPLRQRSTENDHDASLFFPSVCRVSRTFVRPHALSPSRTCQQRLLRSVLVPPKSTCTTVLCFSECSSQERSFGCQLAATSLEVSRTLFLHFLVTRCGSFVVGYFRSERCAV